jgi:leucyl/phenylalanyl-tRNA--protein transferase
MTLRITPEILVQAYAGGIFPMAFPEEHDRILWFSPDPRAIIPLDGFHVPRSVRKLLRDGVFSTTTDAGFEDVVRSCAGRAETWISKEMIALYCSVFRLGYGHSVEVWQGDRLVGGLYGIAIGGAFFGESMYSDVSNASKVALVDLAERLRTSGFKLLDTQYLTPHLEQFGGTEIGRADFMEQLESAIALETAWVTDPGPLGTEDMIR